MKEGFQQSTGSCKAYFDYNRLKQRDKETRRHWETVIGGPVSINSKISYLPNKETGLIKGNVEINSLVCKQCKVKFFGRSKVSNLNKHINATHLNKRPFSCDLCKKRFHYPYKLEQHKNTVHRGIKPYRCQDCGKKFSDKSNLTKHNKSRSCVGVPWKLLDT